jgi:secreted PhoX family phosphatase
MLEGKMGRIDRNSSKGAGRGDIRCNPSPARTLEELIATRLSRRDFVRRLGTASALGLLGGTSLARSASATGDALTTLTFEEIEHGIDSDHHVAKGYSAEVLIRWGDGVHAGAPAFDPLQQSAAAQERQFGYNCDFIAYMPLARPTRHTGCSASTTNTLMPS